MPKTCWKPPWASWFCLRCSTPEAAASVNRLSRAVDVIEKRSQQNRPWKVVTVRRGLKEDPDAARDRHFAAHPEDRGADVVIFEFS